MSSNAVYELTTNDPSFSSIHCYLATDGQPEATAAYFWQMHQQKRETSSFAARIFKVMPNAEFITPTSENKGGEYEYHLQNDGYLTVYQKIMPDEADACMQAQRWQLIYQGSWFAFVNHYLKNGETLYLFNLAPQQQTVMTLAEAQQYADACMAQAKEAFSQDLWPQAETQKSKARYLYKQIKTFKQHV